MMGNITTKKLLIMLSCSEYVGITHGNILKVFFPILIISLCRWLEMEILV